MLSPSKVCFTAVLALGCVHAQNCVPAPDAGRIQAFQQPDRTAPAAAGDFDLSSQTQPAARTGSAKTLGSGVSAEEWFEIQQGPSTGWVPAGQVVCRFSPEEAQQALEARAKQAFTALKLRHYARLSQLAHPHKGVRFSPYGYVDTSVNPVLTRKQIAALATDPRRRTWGSHDGTGEPIRLTFAQYFRKYIWDRDYTRPVRQTYNAAARTGPSPTLDRIWEIFPNATLVNAYFPGSDPDGGAMDWSGLWLVFERIGDAWYLTGIVHDAWTI